MVKKSNLRRLVAVVGAVVAGAARGDGLDRQPSEKVNYDKPPAFREAQDASKGFKVPKGFKMDVFAAEPQLVNPVAFTTDEKGRLYVVETFRYRGNGTIDMRNFQHWLDDDLAARTVEDRVAWIKKDAGKDADDFTLDSDQVRMLEDTDGDGKADRATVFAGDFHGMADGLAAGVLARKGSVYLTNIPSLYELKDTKGTGVADVRNVLSTGYGVHFQLLGHDLHGLVRGPDGRLYFSIGDRGCHVVTKEGKVLDNPDSGAVFRCDWDGSNLEMIATGLRNPQELAFDDYGNLFTADNNCDKGDAARWVYVVEGGETGWRMGYQWINEPNSGGPWLGEKLWHLQEDHPAAWCLPPIAHVGPGPSGVAHYPGTGLGDQFKDHFFMCDFRGGTNSGVWEFALKPKGAGFEMTTKNQFVWNLLPTDIEFSVDGGMYISDWVNGWARPMKGRIFKLTNPEAQKDPTLSEVRQLIGEGMDKRPVDELVRLLGHKDQRVRLEAQYEVAGRGGDAVAALQKAAAAGEQLGRIHALWALGQIARKDAGVLSPVVALLEDQDAEVRAQAAKVLGDARVAAAHDGLAKAMKDESARVRFFAAMGVGKLGRAADAARVFELLRENADKDVYLRHAGVMALLWLNDKAAVEAAAKDESASVRLAALLVLRRQMDPSVARFLDDPVVLLQEEAARAINDAFIQEAMPKLAGALGKPKLTRPVWLRAINANLRLGTVEAAGAVARFADDEANSDDARSEAMWAMANWAAPKPRDRVMGLIRPIAPRDEKFPAGVAGPIALKLASTGSPKLRVRAVEVMEKLGVGGDELAGFVAAKDAPSDVRAGALRALETLKYPRLADAAKAAFESGVAPLRREAIGIYLRMPDAGERVGTLFRGASPADQKAILEALGTAKKGVGDSVIGALMDTLLGGTLPAALRLDLLEAAQKSSDKGILAKVRQYEAKRDPKDPLAAWADAIEGGDATRGRIIFFQKESVSCVRCHKIGTDNVVVGPDLSAPTTNRERKHLVESILMPNAQIAPGFESVILKLKGNVTVGGVVKRETDKAIVLIDPNEKEEQEIDKADVVSRTKGLSPMPEGMDKLLTKRELRDLVEFIATLKNGEKVEAAGGHQ